MALDEEIEKTKVVFPVPISEDDAKSLLTYFATHEPIEIKFSVRESLKVGNCTNPDASVNERGCIYTVEQDISFSVLPGNLRFSFQRSSDHHFHYQNISLNNDNFRGDHIPETVVSFMEKLRKHTHSYFVKR